jgi:hypothetical protein
VSQDIGGCDASHSFGYYIRAWPALPITNELDSEDLEDGDLMGKKGSCWLSGPIL